MKIRNQHHLETRLCAVATVALVMLMSACSGPADESVASVQSNSEVETEIWQMEQAIFEGRSQGDITNYLNSASEHYLGWPPVLPTPTSLETLKASADQAVALRGEVNNLTKKGFTRNGSTALMYFLNHQTRVGDGMADEGQREVNRYYENVHIWNMEGDSWKLIGGFARTVDGPRS